LIGNNAESGPRVCHQLVVALPPLVAPSDKLKESYFVDLGKILKEYFFFWFNKRKQACRSQQEVCD